MTTRTSPRPPSGTVTFAADITSLAPVNRSSTVVAGLASGDVAVWTGRTAVPAVILKPHTVRVLAVGSSSDGRQVWSVAADGSLACSGLGPAATVTSAKVNLGPLPTRAAAFSSDGSVLVTGGDRGEIRVFDTGSGALRHQLRGHRTELQAVAVRPGSAMAASASAESDLRLWDTSAGREIGFVDGDLSLFAVAFSPRDGTLASGGVDRRLTLREPGALTVVSALALPAPWMIASLAWSPDGRFIAVGDLDDATLSKGRLRIVEARNRAVVASLDTGGAPAAGLAFVDQGALLVGIIGRDLRAWAVDAIG